MRKSDPAFKIVRQKGYYYRQDKGEDGKWHHTGPCDEHGVLRVKKQEPNIQKIYQIIADQEKRITSLELRLKSFETIKEPLKANSVLQTLPFLPKVPKDLDKFCGNKDLALETLRKAITEWKKDINRPQLKVVVDTDFCFNFASRHVGQREQFIIGRDDVKILVFDWVEI